MATTANYSGGSTGSSAALKPASSPSPSQSVAGNANGAANYSCQRCQNPLSLSASLLKAIEAFDQSMNPTSSGESSNATSPSSSHADFNSALNATGITGLLGVSTYDVIPRARREKSLPLDHRLDSAENVPPGSGGQEGSTSNGAPAVIEVTPAAAANQEEKDSAKAAAAAATPRPNSLSSTLAVRSRLIDLLNSHNPPEPSPYPATSSKASLTRNLSSSSAKTITALQEPDRGSTDGGSLINGKRRKDEPLKIHHPLCKDCTDQLLELMHSEISMLRKERDAYNRFDSVVSKAIDSQAREGSGERKLEALRDELRVLQQEEAKAKKSLYASEKEKAGLEAEWEQLQAEEKKLEEEEKDFWIEYSRASLEMKEVTNRLASLHQTVTLDRGLLDKLKKTNVFNDAFCIGHEAGFATMNGLRFGKSSSGGASGRGGASKDSAAAAAAYTVEWQEINAAWGQTVLLLDTLARNVRLEFKGYKLHPKGSFSAIEKLHHSSDPNAKGEMLELHYSNDWSMEALFGRGRKFDKGMEAFLDCLNQLIEFATSKDENLRLPHSINKDKIGGASIRMPGSVLGQSEEGWTRALRHVLLTLKVLMSWVVNDVDADEDSLDGGSEEEQHERLIEEALRMQTKGKREGDDDDDYEAVDGEATS